MDILSLNEPPQAPSRRLSRAEAIGLSMLVHALILLLFLRGVEGLPAPLARWLKAHASRPPVPEATAQVAPAPVTSAEKERKKAEEEKKQVKIPLRFAYVKVPEQAQPQAPRDPRTFSDRDRAARQPVPTPPDAKRLTENPHAEGDSREKFVPDPRIKKGKNQPEPPQPETDRIASKDVLGRENPADGAGGQAAKPGPQGPAAAEETPGREGREGNDAPPPDANGRGLPAHPGRPGLKRTPYGGGQVGGPSASRGPELRDSTEEKFHFENTGWMRDPIDGDLSFDTKGLPWGDYARKIHVIIRQNWIDRLPLAFRQGQRGVTCQYFVIERDGTISSVDVVRESHVPPFDRAASDALRASSALPPLPPEFNLEKEGVTYCFYYNVYRFEDD